MAEDAVFLNDHASDDATASLKKAAARFAKRQQQTQHLFHRVRLDRAIYIMIH